jgi:hypothetical protein
MQERHEAPEQVALSIVKARPRHQVVDRPLVDSGERAGCDRGGERCERADE